MALIFGADANTMEKESPIEGVEELHVQEWNRIPFILSCKSQPQGHQSLKVKCETAGDTVGQALAGTGVGEKTLNMLQFLESYWHNWQTAFCDIKNLCAAKELTE